MTIEDRNGKTIDVRGPAAQRWGRRSLAVRRPMGGIIALMASLGFVRVISAQCHYEVIVLDTPDCNDGSTMGFGGAAITDDGIIVGGAGCVFGPNAAGLWTGGTVQLLPNPGGYDNAEAEDVNEFMQIVGWAPLTGSNKPRAVIWEGGVPMLLPPPPEGTLSFAWAINDSGAIVGTWGNSALGPGSAAAMWIDGQLIGNLHGDLQTYESAATDINDDGQVTGWMGQTGLFDGHAYIWDDGSVIDLGVIPGGYTAEAQAINEGGHVVGFGRVKQEGYQFGVLRAFYWDGTQMINLGSLPGHDNSRANALNDIGQIVGSSGDPGAAAFLWQHGVMHNLSQLMTPGFESFDNPTSINNRGEIVFSNGRILVRPIDSPLGDIDKNCIVNVVDLLMLLGEWGNDGSFADTNDDGLVNVTDLLQVLADWG